MKAFGLLLFVAASVSASQVEVASHEIPMITKMTELFNKVIAEITDEGKTADADYKEFSAFCDDFSTKIDFEIKTAASEIESLKADAAKETAAIEAFDSKIEELSGSIASDESDLKAATKIRAEEAAEFAAQKTELQEIMGTLSRAISILERELSKSGASMLQLQSAGSITHALAALVQASVLSSTNAGKITAFAQSLQEDGDEELDAPAGAVYESKSGGIVDTLEDLLAKAQSQLADLQKTETESLHNFQMLKQSLTDQMEYASSDMADAKKGLAASKEALAVATGDLAVTTKDYEADKASKAGTAERCATAASDYEAGKKSREEELATIMKAAKIGAEKCGGKGQEIVYGSFVQISRSQFQSSAALANFEAVHFVRDLARKHHSPELVQLALRMAHAMHMGGRQGQDPFSKVKGLIMDMIEKLSEDAQADASQKAYCDKETGETQTTMQEKSSSIEKLTTKIDVATAATSKLKSEVAALEKELAELAKSQAEMTATRQEEHATFVEDKAAMEAGVEGVKQALKVLKDYYASDGKAHSAATAGEGIISLLEVCESDFTKGLSQMIAIEETSASTYETTTKENDITKVTKEQSVKYKTKESAKLDKDIAELSSDRSGEKAELAAKTEYLGKLMKMCIAQPETYTERKSRREAEIAGLKEAMAILDGESMLLQRAASRRALRR
mmetsp:Transcript_159311/g.293621  ORF Transcript_159311/g.293621 Transcript_159311/m.293621 type:complete len:682 (+) Transcript_159311:63-2108(+)